jgi:hypothetical protein
MAQEIFDIIPPKRSEKIIPSFKRDNKKPKSFKRRNFNFGIKKILLIPILILLLILSFYFLTPPRVEIGIRPEMNVFSSDFEIKIDKETKEINILSQSIPGTLLEENNFISQKISSTGKVLTQEKAMGIIRVYNDYSSLPQTLRESTRFMSSDGKVFRAPERIVIPGRKIENGKEVPGYIDVEVIADEPGPEYNIKAASFSVPGLTGTALHANIYGESFEEMKGGINQEVAQVTQEDIAKAEEQVIQKLKEEGKKTVIKKAQDAGNILLEETLVQEVISTSTLIESGAKVDDFIFSSEVKTKGLLFSKKDIQVFIQNYLREKDLKKEKIYDKSLVMDWEAEEDSETGIVTLKLNFSVETYLEMSEFDLKKEIAGKDIFEAELFLENKEEIASVDLNKSSFWIRKIPEDFGRIKIDYILD